MYGRGSGSLRRLLSSKGSSRDATVNSAAEQETAHEFDALNTLLVVVILGLCVLASYLIRKYKCYYMPESAAALLIGLCVGGIAQANPSKAAWAAFRTAKGMYIIPLMFGFTGLLVIDQPLYLLQTFGFAVIGFLASSTVIVGHMYVRLSVLERIITSLAALGMFWPSLLFQIVGTVIFVAIFLSQRARYTKSLKPQIASAE